jgi:hypothetical protein
MGWRATYPADGDEGSSRRDDRESTSRCDFGMTGNQPRDATSASAVEPEREARWVYWILAVTIILLGLIGVLAQIRP